MWHARNRHFPTLGQLWDKRTQKGRILIERMFCRLRDFGRIAVRNDKLARNFYAAFRSKSGLATGHQAGHAALEVFDDRDSRVLVFVERLLHHLAAKPDRAADCLVDVFDL